MELLRPGVNGLSVHLELTWDLGKQVLKKTHFYFLRKDLKVILHCKEILVDLKKCSSKNSPLSLRESLPWGLDEPPLNRGQTQQLLNSPLLPPKQKLNK